MRWGQLKDTISDPRASKREIGRGAPWLCEAPFLLPPGRTWPTQSSLACWRTPGLALPLASLRTTAPAEREYGRMRETLHLQLLLCLIKALGVWGVDDIDEDVRVVKIVPPVRPESCMTPAHIAKNLTWSFADHQCPKHWAWTPPSGRTWCWILVWGWWCWCLRWRGSWGSSSCRRCRDRAAGSAAPGRGTLSAF